MVLQTKSEEVIRLLPQHHVLPDKFRQENTKKNTTKRAYEVIMVHHLHMLS